MSSASEEGRTFGWLLRHHRTLAGLTQEQLAERAGLSARAITDLERGARRYPYPDTLARLSEALRLGESERAAVATAGRRRPRTARHKPSVGVAPHNLPTPLTSFIGREPEIAALRKLVESARLVTVIGTGGVGKTRLALRVAAEMLDLFEDGVYCVDLTPAVDPGVVLTKIAQVLGLPAIGVQPVLQQLQAALAHKKLVLVLDNFERVAEAGPQITELLRATPELHVLITSRMALNVSGEHELMLQPLQLPDQPGQRVAESEAVCMFVERSRLVRPDFRLTDDNMAAVAEICQRLDGLPLALELAAARMRLLTPQELLKRLERRLPMLTGGGRDLPARQQALRSTLAWSYDMLTAAEQTLFRRLPVFAGSFTIESAEAVCDSDGGLCGQTPELFENLLRSSLLRETGGVNRRRFAMLETVREYAYELLRASGEELAMRRNYANCFAGLLQELERQNRGRELSIEWRQRLEDEHDNFRSVLRWSLDVQDLRTAMQLGAGLSPFWAMRGYLAEGRNAMDQVLALPGASAPTVQRARILVGAGMMAELLADFPAAEGLYTEAVSAARVVDDPISIMRALNNHAGIAVLQCDYTSARRMANEGLELAIVERDRGRQALLLNCLGNCAYAEGELEKAESLAKQSLAAASEIVASDHESRAWNLLGRVARVRGDYVQAQQWLERSLTSWRQVKNEFQVGRLLARLGDIARVQRDFDRAQALLSQAVESSHNLGDAVGVVWCLEMCAELAANRGEAERALLLTGAAARQRDVLGTPISPVERRLLEPVLEPARWALGERSATVWEQGRSMPLDAAVALAAT